MNNNLLIIAAGLLGGYLYLTHKGSSASVPSQKETAKFSNFYADVGYVSDDRLRPGEGIPITFHWTYQGPQARFYCRAQLQSNVINIPVQQPAELNPTKMSASGIIRAPGYTGIARIWIAIISDTSNPVGSVLVEAQQIPPDILIQGDVGGFEG